jgi:phage FluMu protein Com
MRRVREGTVAVSRDLFWAGWTFGRRVYIEGHGVFEINDLMNQRYERRVDVFQWSKEKAKAFGAVERRVALLENYPQTHTDKSKCMEGALKQEIRCKKCNRLLMRGEITIGTVEIRCPKCNYKQILNDSSKKVDIRLEVSQSVLTNTLRGIRSPAYNPK